MSQDEVLSAGESGNLRGLACCGMSAFGSESGKLVGVGGFVVNPSRLFHRFGDTRIVSRVAAIGIADARVGVGSEHMVRDSLQVGRNEVGAVSQIVVEIDWHLVETHHIALDVAQFGLFAEQEPRGRHAMLKRESLHGDGIVLIYYGLLAANDVEFNLIAAIGKEEVEKLAEHLSTLGIDVNGERAGALVQVESSEQPRQPEAVVAVQVAYENMV